MLALDAGSATTPLLASYRLLAPTTAWDATVGFGWFDSAPQSRDRAAPDPLRRDMVTDTDPGVLRLQLPPGRRLVSVLRGDHGFSTTGVVVEADGQVVVPSGPTVGSSEYWWEQFPLDGGTDGRTVDLRISSAENVYWKLLALLVQ